MAWNNQLSSLNDSFSLDSFIKLWWFKGDIIEWNFPYSAKHGRSYDTVVKLVLRQSAPVLNDFGYLHFSNTTPVSIIAIFIVDQLIPE